MDVCAVSTFWPHSLVLPWGHRCARTCVPASSPPRVGLRGGLLDHVGILLHLVGDCHIICHSSPALRHSSSNRCLCVCLSVSVSQCVCLCVSVCGVCDITATCRRVKSWLAAVVCIPSWSVAGGVRLCTCWPSVCLQRNVYSGSSFCVNSVFVLEL